MESDRMGYLLPALTPQRFETQRDVVLNERRQSYENRPYGLAMMAILAALFPPEHPYHWMTIGSSDDIRSMQFADVQAFFRTYYHPANASLVLAGAIDTARAFDLADRYFGDLPGRPRPPNVQPPAADARACRMVIEDRVELPRVYMAWHSPAMFADGDADLDLVAEVLASGKMSRLYKSLVYDRRLAVDVSAYQGSRELGSFFVVVATAAPDQSLDDVAAAIDAEIRRLADEGPSESEMERVLSLAEAHFVYRLQTLGGFGGRSDQLNAYNVLRGDPGYAPADLERYRTATRDTVRAAAARYLPTEPRVLLSVVPRGQPALALSRSEPVLVS
jgi:zinc protease